ncbi:MAG TPA: MFS transporter [Caulobacteraceae bacterium]|nr:MFS transporter [Caulobacteraceae bacterium]
MTSTIAGAPVALRPRHVAAATIGNALEFYDFLTYAFFSIQIGHAFFPAAGAYASLMLSLATFGAGFITRPIGALVIGAYSDRVGRRPAMMLCFVMIGLSIVAMALIPPYAAIGVAAPVLAVIARMVQGFSLGGEVGSNSAYLLEAAPLRHRGLALSWQGASQGMALIAAGLVGTLLTSVLPAGALETYGWRIAFLLGAVAVPFGLWLRSAVPETLHAPEPSPAEAPASRPAQTRLGQARGAWRILVLGLVVLAAGTIGSYTFTYIVTYAQATLHMSARSGFLAETAGNVIGIAAALAGGALSDRIGRWPVNVGGNLAFLLLTYPVFAWVVATRSEPVLIAGVALLAVAANFNAGSFYASLAESLPKTIRGSAFGTVYAVSIAAFGGTTQLVVTWLIHVTGSPMAPAWYLIAATAIGQLAYLMIRESAPSRLRPAPAPIAAAAAA